MPASREVFYPNKYEFLRVSVEPVEDRPLYFTEDMPEFDLVVENTSDKRILSRDGDGIIWVIGMGNGYPEAEHWGELDIELEPGEEVRKRIGGGFLAFEGNGAVGITGVSIPGGTSGDDVIFEASPPSRSRTTWMYTFRVWDESHYHLLHEQPRTLLRRSYYLTVGVLIVALITALSAVLQITLALGWVG